MCIRDRYKPGKKLTNADGLSRRDYSQPPSVSDNDVVDDDNILSAVDIDPSGNTAACTHQTAHNKCMHAINFIYDVASNSNTTTDNIDTSEVMNISALVDSTNIAAEQHQCSDFRHIFAYLETGELPDDNTVARRTVFESEQYTIISCTLYHLYAPRQKGKDIINTIVQQLCIPSKLRDDITKAYHDNNGHIGFDKLYESIRNKYYWPRTYAELSEYVKNCSECQQTKRPVHKKKAPLKPLPVVDVFARFHLDYLRPLPPLYAYRYLLVAIDSTSLYSEIHPTKTCDADETAIVLYEQVFCRYGCPLSILTDRGSCFCSALFNALCKIFKVKRIFTSSFHLQTKSGAENMNSTILKSIRIYCKIQTEWSTSHLLVISSEHNHIAWLQPIRGPIRQTDANTHRHGHTEWCAHLSKCRCISATNDPKNRVNSRDSKTKHTRLQQVYTILLRPPNRISRIRHRTTRSYFWPHQQERHL